MSKSDAIDVSEVSIANVVKRKGWQRVLMYPAVLGALIGAVPTGLDYYKAFVYDIDFQNVKHAEEQQRLWVKNFTCAQNISRHQVKTEKNILVQVGACANGDVLIEVVPPKGNRVLQWISLERLADRLRRFGPVLYRPCQCGDRGGIVGQERRSGRDPPCARHQHQMPEDARADQDRPHRSRGQQMLPRGDFGHERCRFEPETGFLLGLMWLITFRSNSATLLSDLQDYPQFQAYFGASGR